MEAVSRDKPPQMQQVQNCTYSFMKPEEETAAEPLPPILPATCDEPLPPILPATCNLVGDMIVIDEEEFEGVKPQRRCA